MIANDKSKSWERSCINPPEVLIFWPNDDVIPSDKSSSDCKSCAIRSSCCGIGIGTLVVGIPSFGGDGIIREALLALSRVWLLTLLLTAKLLVNSLL